jgi:UDP-glucose 4-epimerase
MDDATVQAVADMRRTAVVGAGGFIGSHLSAALEAAGHSVVPVTRDRPAVSGTALRSDLHDVATVLYVAGGINPATANAHPERGPADVAEFGRLLEAFGRLAVPPRVVLASSGGTVYDDSFAPPYREDSPVLESTVYSAAKLAMERLLTAYDAPTGSTVVRLANVYGPGQRVGTGQGVVAHWIDAALRGRPLTIFGAPETVRDYVYVADATAAMVAIAAAPTTPMVVNVGSGEPTSLAELARVVQSVATEARYDVEIQLVPSRTFDRQRVWLDVSLARASLGWRPNVGLVEGVRHTWHAASRALPTNRDE